MKVARAGHSATLIPDSRSGTVLIAGGIGHHGVTDSAELFIPGSGFVKVQHMKSPRFLHAAAFIPTGRQVLIAGGAHDSQLDTVATAERYDPTHGIFSYTIMPMHIARRSFSAAAKIPIQFSDMVILPGGENASGIPQRDTDIYLPLK